MRSTLFSFLLAFLAAVAMAVPPTLYDVIISFPAGTPDSVVDDAKKRVVDSKGVVTHEYSIIQGFAAKMPKDSFAGIQAMSTEYPPTIEGDGLMTTQENGA